MQEGVVMKTACNIRIIKWTQFMKQWAYFYYLRNIGAIFDTIGLI